MACGDARPCLLDAAEVCLEGLTDRVDPERPHPSGASQDATCTIAETWERVVLSKALTGCPGWFLHTDEGFHCRLFLPNGREIRWTRVDDDWGFISIGDDPREPSPSNLSTLIFYYDLSVPTARITHVYSDGTFRSRSFCD